MVTSVRWLVERREHAPRWPTSFLLSLIALFTTLAVVATRGEALMMFFYALRHLRIEPLLFVFFVVACIVQWFRPTVLGWVLIFVPIVTFTLFLGFSHKFLDYQGRLVVLAAGSCLAAMSFLFRPINPGKHRTLVLLMICLSLCGGETGLEKYREATKKPMGDSPLILFPRNVSLAEGEKTLSGEFQIVTKMKKLPPAIQALFKEQYGTRLAIANPGEDFNATDVVLDSSYPWRRLVFAGVSGDRCFVYYEQGGFASNYQVEVFSLPDARPLWHSYVGGEASTLPELRKQLVTDPCCTPK